ncbi:hypothetical protein Tco_0318693 [Tanacetum coccineum]
MANGGVPLEYWLQWQVFLCAIIFILPTIISIKLILTKKPHTHNTIGYHHLWVPCWNNLHPLWLLLFRFFSFVSMAWLLYQTVMSFGIFMDFLAGYNILCDLANRKWLLGILSSRQNDPIGTTEMLCGVSYPLLSPHGPEFYLSDNTNLGTIISAHGCWMHSKEHGPPNQERDEFLKKDSSPKVNEGSQHNHTQVNQEAGFWGNLMQNLYQTCAGAVVLTDIVFWCLLLPFQTGDNFKLTLLIGCMHSVNAVFLLLDSALNSLVSNSRAFHLSTG